jgi:hypothetical protein
MLLDHVASVSQGEIFYGNMRIFIRHSFFLLLSGYFFLYACWLPVKVMILKIEPFKLTQSPPSTQEKPEKRCDL